MFIFMDPGFKSTFYCNGVHEALSWDGSGVRIQLRAYGQKLEGRPTSVLLQWIPATDLLIRNKK